MISNRILKNIKNASWIRAMFEEGEKLRKIYGQDNVFDFTLGNPDNMPPKKVLDSIKSLKNSPDIHKYMNNAGFLDVREKIAKILSKENDILLTAKNIIMTCGAAGGINVILNTILNPNDEVIIFSPYFVEYNFYIENYQGKTVIANTEPKTFLPDIEILKEKITKSTKAIIINSPNNPTGVVYGEQLLIEMSKCIEEASARFGIEIYIISDEPYQKLIYDGVVVPSVLKIFKNAFVVNSFSKSLALPGERIGYIAVNNKINDLDILIDGLIFSNRTLGFVNAPSLFQKVVRDSIEESVDVTFYKKRRDILYKYLLTLGFDIVKPQGTFYLFPKALINDDILFVKTAIKYNLLLVPGTGFGCPGYFRIAYCVNEHIIKKSLDAFKALRDSFL